MREPELTYQHKGFTIEIHRDEEHSSDEALGWSRVGHIIIEHREYALGDEQRLPEFERECPNCEGEGTRTVVRLPVGLDLTESPKTWHDVANIILSTTDEPLSDDYFDHVDCPECQGVRTIEEDAISFFKRTENARVVIPIHVYRSWLPSLTLGKPNEPDPDADGYIFDTPQAVREVLGENATDEQIEEALRGEISEYSAAMEGNVFGFIVKDAAGNDVEDGDLWGMVDSDPNLKYVKQEAEMVADSAAEDAALEAQEAARWACADIITIEGA